ELPWHWPRRGGGGQNSLPASSRMGTHQIPWPFHRSISTLGKSDRGNGSDRRCVVCIHSAQDTHVLRFLPWRTRTGTAHLLVALARAASREEGNGRSTLPDQAPREGQGCVRRCATPCAQWRAGALADPNFRTSSVPVCVHTAQSFGGGHDGVR